MMDSFAPRVAGWLSLATILAGAAGTIAGGVRQEALPVPYVVADVCPFECCVYGEWTAQERLEIRDRPDSDLVPGFTIDSGASLVAHTGNVVVTQVGRARVLADLTLSRMAGDELETVVVPPGSDLPILDSIGEGFVHVWYENEVWDTDFGYMDHGEMRAEVIELAVTEWWVRVTRADGRDGWLRADDPGAVAGNDACGAPAGS